MRTLTLIILSFGLFTFTAQARGETKDKAEFKIVTKIAIANAQVKRAELSDDSLSEFERDCIVEVIVNNDMGIVLWTQVKFCDDLTIREYPKGEFEIKYPENRL